MKGQMKSKLLAVALTALLTGLALPSLAGAAVKVTVLAAEHNNNLFVATVLAVATAGNTSNAGTISGISPHVYTGTGSFRAKLTVTDGKGAAGSSSTITVRVR